MNPLLTILKSIPQRTAQALSWAMDNTRLFMEIMLVVALIVGQRMYNDSQKKVADLTDYSGKLAANLKEQITIKDGQIEILKRNGTKVEHDIKYVPQEGKIIIKYSTVTVNGHVDNDGVTVIVKDKGIGLWPGFGLSWAGNGLQVHLDAKVAFYKRYSLLVGGTKNDLDVDISRHIGDWVWGHPANVELFLGYAPIRTGGAAPVVVGLRSNF